MRYLILVAILVNYFNSFSQVTVTITSSFDATCGNCNGQATASAAGGTSPYTYAWSSSGSDTLNNVVGLCAGSYSVIATDFLGASDTAFVTINQNVAVTAAISNFTNTSCFGMCDGTATVVANGGAGGSYTYTWNGVPPQNTPMATGLCTGTYSATVTDSNGCMSATNVSILEPPMLNVTINTTDDTCGLCIGSANAIVSGGTAPYVYSWSMGNTTQIATGLCAGTYTITITDANGCLSSTMATINLAPGNSCGFGTVNGRVYKDDNTNCIQDGGEIGLENVIVQATPGPYYATTDSSGDYSLVAPYGNYTITQVAQPYYNEICPIAGSYSVLLDSINNTLNNNDFADTITPVLDVSVSLISGPPRPGFSFNYSISYSSISTLPVNGSVYLVVDDTLIYQSAAPFPNQISGDTLFWNYANLQQFENRYITATYSVPNDVTLLGNVIQGCAQISPLVGDIDTSNNTSCYSRVIVGSYDPNDKQVVPAGVGPTGDILLSDTELTYTIRFQNSGTFMATNVVVVDTLSANLDVTTLKNISASHPFTYDVSGQGVLTFNFNNIMLPDSNADEPGSHGLIQFTIDQHPSNGIGTVIENTAGIYFDFNPPIITNTVTNTIVTITDVNENVSSLNTVNVYPNPSKGLFAIAFELEKSDKVSIRVVDLLGKEIKAFTNKKMAAGLHNKEWDMSTMNMGIYFMSVQIGSEIHLKKIVIQ
jgi:Secretion system C-terminal sorting domain/SprB repeat